jgi:hypothetical protein
MPQDFGAASRGDLLFGIWMVVGSSLLVVLHFVFEKALKSPDESDEVDVDRPDNGPEIVHVVPPE